MAEAKSNAPMKKKPATKRKHKKTLNAKGKAYINASFNNTIVTITDKAGNAVTWASAGTLGFKGSKKSTPFAAQMASEACAKVAIENGMSKVEVTVKGPGAGTTEDSLAKLKCCSGKADGIITAGNASGINDGAAAMVLASGEMVEKLGIAIHQFAKRQMTWFRGMERKGVQINWVKV